MVPIWLAALADMLGPTAQTQSEIFNLFLVHKTLSEIVNLLLGLQSVSVQAALDFYIRKHGPIHTSHVNTS
jgi:hypothetical protein